MGTVIGIDPGLTGAVAVFNKGELVAVYDMPVVPRMGGKGKELSGNLLREILTQHLPATFIVEKVGAMPGNGGVSMFNFGLTAGVTAGVIYGLKQTLIYVRPQKWKKSFGLIKKPKDAARTLVIERYPAWSNEFARKKDGGRADAVLIGLWGVKEVCGNGKTYPY